MAWFTTRRILLGFSALTLAAFASIVFVGNLEPPGPPGSTMHTLDEIYDLLVDIFDLQTAAEIPDRLRRVRQRPGRRHDGHAAR